jgi:hypothetical protein
LPKMQLRTNSLQLMNDPKENQPWSFGGRNIDYKGSYPKTYSRETHIEHQFILGDEIKSSSQIICFVKDVPEKGYLNEIMWAHYSNNHKGVCLELEKDQFLHENKEQIRDSVFEPVIYGQVRKPFIGWEPNIDKNLNIQRFVRTRYKDLFLSKSNYWERESEVRLIIFEQEQKYLSIRGSLTGIYFGLQMLNQYRPAIDILINDKQTSLYNLYYENEMLKIAKTENGNYRPFIMKKFVRKY